MNNWNKLLIYELLLLNGNSIIGKLQTRIEKFKQDGNIFDESISPEIVAQQIKTWYDNIIEQEKLKKEKQYDENRANLRERWRKLAEELVDESLTKKVEVIPTSDWQLGYFIGQIIIDRYLPSLSVDNNTFTVINITNEETDEYNKLNEAFSNVSIDDKSKEWKDYQTYRSFLKDKYLPKELLCYVDKIYFASDLEFKKGLGNALWNSDVSYYSSKEEDIDVTVDEYSTIIKLKL